MMATIWMTFDDIDGEQYYGCFPFNTHEERNKVNDLGKQIGIERNCSIRIEYIEGNI